MNRKLVIFGLSCMIAGSLLSILFTLAKGQLQSADPQTIQNCKIAKDSIALDKALGVPTNQVTALENLYNDTCGTVR